MNFTSVCAWDEHRVTVQCWSLRANVMNIPLVSLSNLKNQYSEHVHHHGATAFVTAE